MTDARDTSSPRSFEGEPLIRVGALAGAHGLAGEANLRTTDDAPDWLGVVMELFATPHGQPPSALKILRVSSIRRTGPGMARARFEGIASRTALEQTLGAVLSRGTVYIRRRDLPPPPPGEFRVDALIGLAVVEGVSGRRVGVVRDVLSASGADFLEIQTALGADPALIPFNEAFFPDVDVQSGILRVERLEGFFDSDA